MAQQDAKARQTQHLPSQAQARSPIGTLRYFPLPWHTKGRRLTTRYAMEKIVNLHIERLPEGVYLATSDNIPGLVAQGRTVTETLEDCPQRRQEAAGVHAERQGLPKLKETEDSFDYPLVVSGGS